MRRVYKIVHSKSGDMIVYRKLYWSPQIKTGIIGFVSVALLSLGTFLLIPTPEDFLSVGGLARFFTKHYGISGERSLLYGLLTVKGTAVLLIVIASVLGGEYIREMFHTKVIAKVDRHRERLADWIRPK